MSELVLTILSQNTSDTNSGRAFMRLRSRFKTWEELMAAPPDEIVPEIQPGGLARIKAPRIKGILEEIWSRLGSFNLSLLEEMPMNEAKAWLRSLPGVGPTLAAILLAEIGDIAWYTRFSQLRKLAGLDIQRVQTGQWAGTARISKAGRPLLRWALYQAALGAARTPTWRARREGLIAKRRGDRYAFFKATVELAAKLLRLVWGVWRSGCAYDPARVGPGPAARPRPERGRRRAPPSPQGQAEIGEPRGNQAARSSGTPAGYRGNGTSRRS